MLKELITAFAFLLCMAGILSCLNLLQKTTENLTTNTLKTIEIANENG